MQTESYIFNDKTAVVITNYGEENSCTVIKLNDDFMSEEDIKNIVLFLDGKNFNYSININLFGIDEKQIQAYKSALYKFAEINRILSYIKDKSTDKMILENKKIRLISEQDEALFKSFPQEQIKNRPDPSMLFDIFIKENEGKIAVFTENEILKGYLSFGLMFSNIYDVDYIYVVPEYRNQKIGKKLALYVSELLISENNILFWDCDVNDIQSSKTALSADFMLCCERIKYKKA
jgi:GNAT superfamily N-acetyltransferase